MKRLFGILFGVFLVLAVPAAAQQVPVGVSVSVGGVTVGYTNDGYYNPYPVYNTVPVVYPANYPVYPVYTPNCGYPVYNAYPPYGHRPRLRRYRRHPGHRRVYRRGRRCR